MVACISFTVGVIAYYRYRRTWQLLYLVCAAAWIVDVGAHYVGWFAFEASGIWFRDSDPITWFELVLLSCNVIVLPLWLLVLIGRTVTRTAVLIVLGNFVVFLAFIGVLAYRFAVHGHEGTILDVVIVILISLQTDGLYFGSLTYAFLALRTRSSADPRRDFRPFIVVMIALAVFGYISELGMRAVRPESYYRPRIELPIFLLAGFGYIGFRQARRLVGRSDSEHTVVDEEFFAEYELSPREREVALLLRSDGRARDIAERLFVSETTINSHIRNIYRKCDIHSRVELVSLMRRYERVPAHIVYTR